jgi:hypothetical protein
MRLLFTPLLILFTFCAAAAAADVADDIFPVVQQANGDSVGVIPVRLKQRNPYEVEVTPVPAPVPADYDLGAKHTEIIYPTFSIRLGVPQIISASAGLIIGRIQRGGSSSDPSLMASGMLIELEAGVGGGKASIGIEHTRIMQNNQGTFANMATIALKGSVLHTWGQPIAFDLNQSFVKGIPTGQTYIGPELELGAALQVTIGYLFGVSSGAQPDRIFTLSIGSAF